ncbi:glycosyltransferase family 2 protein [Oribacterium sp. WCC10]|uniref:glycosyltransferase family 2 protein n=1 Tax=Oribacterium sp. WCC10 TaxID=1855343 RepID=UPI0008EC13C9|nr:glycosyltransferase family 2 protein [Oribacterium sp. WCC10]SFG80596.1 rhamnosyltransferase [Oribacterium sp. WCC10]
MKKILVMMSTYNGERYIREQLNSIITQIGVDVKILVRDDGSNDRTVDIIKEFEQVDIIESKNVGVKESFFELISMAGKYDYYAFADQDDVWDENKLKIAVDKLEEVKKPAIYSSNTTLVDEHLECIKVEALRPITTLGSAIVKNYATGCTVVFNSLLMEYLKAYRPRYVSFHDWWVNLVCLSIGGVSLYDYEPHMKYRQHGTNVVSGNSSFLKKWISRINKFFNTKYNRDKVALEILENYSDSIKGNNRLVLEAMVDNKAVAEMSCGNFLDDFLFRVCLIFGKQ